MFSLLHLLSYVGAVAAFLFVTLSLASGLLWLAELIEEHSRYAKIIGMRGIYTIIGLHVLLLYTDSLPALPIFFSIACHLIYLSNFTSSWPVISLSSPRFLASCLLVIADHFTWFFHFANKANEAKRRSPNRYSYGNPKSIRGEGEHGFMDVAAFFGICVWAAPLFLFLSLSANDNALPSMGTSAPPTPIGGTFDLTSASLSGGLNSYGARANQPRTSLLKSVLVPLVSLLPRLRRRKRNDDEGLLAPRTPLRGSPLHSPVHLSNGPSGNGYFPWGGETGPISRSGTPINSSSTYGSLSASTSSGSGFSMTGPGLSPDTAMGLPRPAGPPRKVQSEFQISRGPPNPRGVATRNGIPFAADDSGKGEGHPPGGVPEAESMGRSSSSMGHRGGDSGAARVSTEILEGLTRRKAD